MMNHQVAPSILAADFGNLERDIATINNSEADYLHVDIMDGQFVPNISFGQDITKVMHKLSDKPLDVHLMIEKPERYVESFVSSGASILTVHLEASVHLHRTLQAIKAEGMKAGVAINPHTSVDLLKDVINDIDVVLIMSVNPGFGGQSFIDNTFNKVQRLKKIIAMNNASTLIEIDGGVTDENAAELAKAGADILVAGSFVFKAEDQPQTIKNLKQIANS